MKTNLKFVNRHGQILTNVSNIDFRKLYTGNGWMVLNGEYLNKNKNDENNNKFNHKFILFDILVYNSNYLIGETFDTRIKIMDDLYNKIEFDKSYLYKINDDFFRVKSFDNDFKKLFEELSKIDMIEGLVLKRKNAKLEKGNREINNNKSQLKVRKATKNYTF